MKAFRGKLGHLLPGKQKDEDDRSEGADASRAGEEGPPSPGTPAAAMTPPPQAMLRSATPPKGTMKVKMGPPPLGAKIMKGPPPGGRVSPPSSSFMSHGAGAVSPNSAAGRPLGALPPGAKLMNGPPPAGARIMAGPPPGAKGMAGPLPPGAKKMMSAPPANLAGHAGAFKLPPGALPPGAKVMSGPPPGAKIFSGPPSGAKIMSGPPPGAKVVHAPPPGARLIKRPMSRPGTPESPGMMNRSQEFNFASSRPATPEHPSMVGSRLIPSPPAGVGMKKMMVGAPPPGAKLVTMPPPRSASPSLVLSKLPATAMLGKSPAKMQMRLSPARPDGLVTPRMSAPSTPQLVPQSGSFSRRPSSPGQPGSGKSSPQLVRPVPLRTKGPPGGKADLQIPQPGGGVAGNVSDGDADAMELRVEGEDGNDDDIKFDADSQVNFEVETPAKPGAAKSPRGTKTEGSINFQTVGGGGGGSSTSSNFFREEADAQTALPLVHDSGGPRSNNVNANQSLHSSSLIAKTIVSEVAPPHEKDNKRKHKSRKEEVGDVEAGGKEKRKHRRRKSTRKHHRSRKAARSSSSSSPSTSGSTSSTMDGDRRPRATRSPAKVDTTKPRSSRPSQQRRTDVDGDNDSGADGDTGGSGSGSFAPQFSQQALTAKSLTPPLRSRIVDQFLSILCAQQYYGKVKKINGIRPLNADRAQASGLRKHNCIYVATKGVMPNQYFYPQLRLFESDGQPTVDDKDRGTLDTPIMLYEAAPGNMLFANSEVEAQRLLETSRTANSCFVLSCSAIIFKDPEHYVLPLAMLNVRWTPYASPQSEPQCPIHRTELQLFDPYTKELVCALCTSKDRVNVSKLVVIPDVLKGDSRRKIHESVSRQLDEAQHSGRMWVGQHQRINQLCANKKEAVQQQFDLLAAAVEAKRKEFLEACDAEYGLAKSDVAREVLLSDDRVQLLSAAADHLRTDGARPLYSMQIATIAEGLETSKQLPSSFTKQSLLLPNISNGVLPKLEGVMSELQVLRPEDNAAAGLTPRSARRNRSPGRPIGTAVSHSPFQAHNRTSDQVAIHAKQSPYRSPHRAQEACVYDNASTHRSGGPRSERALSAAALSPRSRRRSVVQYDLEPRSASVGCGGTNVNQHQQRSSRSLLRPFSRQSGASLPSPRRAPRPLPTSVSPGSRSRRRILSNDDDDYGSAAREQEDVDYRTDAVTVPNSTGTSLFDYPLDELLDDSDEANKNSNNNSNGPGGPPRLRKPRVIQWNIRVEDPGDWVGIGVGVGTTIDAWERGRSNDLSHLWIVPGGPSGTGGSGHDQQVIQMRVTVAPTVGHAKLSIHDSRGRQLDDGSIPQWNASRVCYPQVTFGGRIGQVRMIEAPHIIA